MTEGKLIIFLKNPELGKVKTRLAQRIGDEAALAVSLKLIRQTQAVTDLLPIDKAVYYSSFIDNEDNWHNKKYTKHLQQGENMGERMFNALAQVLSEGYGKAVLIGSDIHLLTEDVLMDAFEKLEANDVVLGPAKDGGYYLIGIKKPEPKLFDLKYWSTPNVFSETVKKIKELKLSYGQTQLLNDIDEFDDLKGTGLYSS